MNDIARGLRSRKSMTVGLLIPELNSTFHTNIMQHVGQFLRLRGYSCIVCDCNADKDVEQRALSFLIDKMVDGIITIPLNSDGIHLSLARERNVPVVLIDRPATRFDTDAVLVDNVSAGRAAAEYLLGRGHVQTAIISGRLSIYTMGTRSKAFIEAYKQHGCGAGVSRIETDFTISGGYDAAKRILSTQNSITSVFCANYELTLGAIAAMNELGMKFPDDISIFGFDNMEMTGVFKPSLTVIEQPMQQIAQTAAALLLERLDGNDKNGEFRTVVLDTKLIEGESVADLR